MTPDSVGAASQPGSPLLQVNLLSRKPPAEADEPPDKFSKISRCLEGLNAPKMERQSGDFRHRRKDLFGGWDLHCDVGRKRRTFASHTKWG